MITDQTILDTVPKAGAERAAAVWSFMKDKHPVVGAARAILAYWEWLSEQSCEMRMEVVIAMDKTVGEIKEARSKFRREAQQVIGK